MPEPTTRRGRYVHRRKKYLARGNHAWSQKPRGAFHLPHGHKHGAMAAKRHYVGDGTKQLFYPTKTVRSYQPNLLIPTFFPFQWYILTHPAKKPPFVSCYRFFSPTWTLPGHPRFAIAGYFLAPVKYRGHKIGRLSGVTRKEHLARHIFLQSGCYPWWDPLHRTPTCS